MLVTRRREGESLVIGSEIEVHVMEVSGGRVKLGISAPKEVRVERKEAKMVHEENLRAAQSASRYIYNLQRQSNSLP